MTTRAAALALAVLLAAPAAPADETGPAPAEKDWKDHKGDIPFIVGREKGVKEAEFTGKPIFFFYTATW